MREIQKKGELKSGSEELAFADNRLLNDNPLQQQEQLTQTLGRKRQLAQIKEKVIHLIDTPQNNSLFAKASHSWGKLPVWQKIFLGIILTVPLFITAIVTHLTLLLAISLFCLINYVASSLLLDNHHQQNEKNNEYLKNEIVSLLTVFELLMDSLNQLNEQLVLELNKFQKENSYLAELLGKMAGEVNFLTSENENLAAIEEKLYTTQQALEQMTVNLNVTEKKYSELLQTSQDELNKIIQAAEQREFTFKAEIIDLEQLNATLTGDLRQAKLIALALQNTLHLLTDTLVQAKDKKEAFQQGLEDLLTNQEKYLRQFTARLGETGSQLQGISGQFKDNNQRYEKLLDKNEEQVERLTRLTQSQESVGAILNKVGFYADTSKVDILDNQSHALSM